MLHLSIEHYFIGLASLFLLEQFEDDSFTKPLNFRKLRFGCISLIFVEQFEHHSNLSKQKQTKKTKQTNKKKTKQTNKKIFGVWNVVRFVTKIGSNVM